MALLSKKHASSCSAPCLAVKWGVAVLLLVAAVAAAVGIYETHIIVTEDPSSVMLQFGSTGGSLAIIAFTLASMSFCKKLMCCMSKTCEVCDA